jgi:hypothetical protein
MPRSPKADRIWDEVSGDTGIGMVSGVSRRMVDASRTPRARKAASSIRAVSLGAGGHLKKPPSTLMTMSPPGNSANTRRTRSAPSCE